MPINNYLVIGVNPTNNEASIPLDKVIEITFAKHMLESTLTASNLVLKKSTGEIVDCTITYVRDTITAKLKPAKSLEPGTTYQVQVMGTANGVKSITEDYMNVSRTYNFTTSNMESTFGPPVGVDVTVDSGFPVVTWNHPSGFDTNHGIIYEVHISDSQDPLESAQWPSAGDLNQTRSTSLNIPKRFAEGTYYAHVRGIYGELVSDYAPKQFVVEGKKQDTPATPNPQPDNGGGNMLTFDVTGTYPARDGVDVTPEEIIIMFSENIDPASVTEDTVYVLKKANKETLTEIDFRTGYSSKYQIPSTLEKEEGNVVTIKATLEDDAEYTVIVRDSVKTKDKMATLGLTYHWSFITKYTQLYGDPAMVRSDIGTFSKDISDKKLYQFLSDSSKYAYQIASATATFNAADYANGAAPYYMHEYVRLRTSYNLLLNTFVQSGGGSATSEVALGDLKVKKESGSGGNVTGLMNALKNQMKPFVDMMHGHHNRGYAKPVTVVRGENASAYPEFLTRAEFSDLGQ